nr:hypothetical protein [Roseomonas acroporae]
MVGAIVTGRATAAQDPRWRESGARSLDEYVRWSGHVCGMACLKMLLAARTGRVEPTIALARRALPHGAYVEEGEWIRGLIYAPFVRFLADEFGIAARVVTEVTEADLPAIMAEAEFFLASVHPDIRWPAHEPPGRGGHLVLVTAASAEAVVFSNPSGHDAASRSDVTLPLAVFGRFFAGRGVAVLPG